MTASNFRSKKKKEKKNKKINIENKNEKCNHCHQAIFSYQLSAADHWQGQGATHPGLLQAVVDRLLKFIDMSETYSYIAPPRPNDYLEKMSI